MGVWMGIRIGSVDLQWNIGICRPDRDIGSGPGGNRRSKGPAGYIRHGGTRAAHRIHSCTDLDANEQVYMYMLIMTHVESAARGHGRVCGIGDGMIV